MTPHDLIAAFETLAEAPDGGKRLRELVLQLAVRGKLVPQDPEDEPAAKLLDKIGKEKLRLVKEGKAKAGKVELHQDLTDVPFDVPHGWTWTRAAVVGWVNPRNQVTDRTEVGFVPMPLMPIDFRDPVRWETRPWAAVKQGFTHFATGDVAVAKITPCFQNSKSCVMAELPNGMGAGTTELQVLRPLPGLLDADYVLAFFKTPDFIDGGVATMTGTAGQQRVSNDYFANRPLPLPPLAEQHRIVDKVNELMAFLDQLEAARNARDATRRAMRDGVLAALRDANDADEVEVAWGRVASGMADLFIEPGDVAPLRQTVLQLAVRGRLVPQDPGEEPAGKLLEKIGKEKAKLVKDGIIRQPKTQSGSVGPCSLPHTWTWASLEAICQSIADGDHQPPPRAPDGVAFLTIGNVTHGYLDFRDSRTVPKSYFERLEPTRVPRHGDLLYTVVGATYGRPVKVDSGPPFCVQRHIAILRPATAMDRSYLFRYLQTPMAYSQATDSTTGIAQPTIGLGPTD
jgi:type I restriction enzyme S subunit